MKVTVSLPAEDVEFLDVDALRHGLGSRAEVVHQAVGLLRSTGLGAAYEEAWHDWSTRGDEADWEITIGDG